MRILAIDDSKLVCNMLNNVLSAANHKVDLAYDGQQGAFLAETNQYDLIITDINMPEINGLDLARILRNKEEYKNTPIIFLTTETSETFKAKGKEITGTTWITKPFSPLNLVAMFDSIFKKLHILAVDDSKSIRRMVSQVLSEAGHTVTTANDGKEALELATEVCFDLVVADINMPEMDGFELVERLRQTEQYKTTPIIFLSTEGSVESREMGKQLGAAAWITKPFNPVKLLDAVASL